MVAGRLSHSVGSSSLIAILVIPIAKQSAIVESG